MGTTGTPSIRAVMLRQLSLPYKVGAQLGLANDQVTALAAGTPVELTREQLQMFGHPELPADLDDHAAWLLTGDSTLTPA
jgi:hypothetical protein